MIERIFNRFFIGIFLVVLSGVCYGFAPVLAVYAYQGGATVSEFVLLRYGFASVFFILYMLYLFIYKRSFFSMLSKISLALMLAAGILQAVASYLYMNSVQYVTPGLAAILFYTYLIWVAVWDLVFNKERLQISGVIGIALALIGLALVVGVSWGKIIPIDIFMGLAAGLALSGFMMTSNAVTKKLEPIVASPIICLITTIPLLLIGSITGTLNFQISTEAWLACAATGIFTAIALFTLLTGIKIVGSTTASVLSSFEPVTAVVLSALLLSQKLTALQLLGSVVIVIGVVLVVTSKRSYALLQSKALNSD